MSFCFFFLKTITHRLNTDFFRLFSKALRSEGSSRVRRSLLAFGWNS